MTILIDNIPADKLREQLKLYNPNDIISIVVSRYQYGCAIFYQVVYMHKY